MAMSTDDNDVYGDLDKSYLKFIYEQFLNIRQLPVYGRLTCTLQEVIYPGEGPAAKETAIG